MNYVHLNGFRFLAASQLFVKRMEYIRLTNTLNFVVDMINIGNWTLCNTIQGGIVLKISNGPHDKHLNGQF